MKHSKLISWLLLLSILFPGLHYAQPTTECEAYLGVWKYELEDREGMIIFSPSHAIALQTGKDRVKFRHAEPTEEEKAAAFDALDAAAATWSCEGNRRN
jgi:hypothetical protein